MTAIKTLFEAKRRLDRPIEKVIDYAAASDDKLAREIGEYEVTTNVETCFRRFLDTFGTGVGGQDVTEIGIWVAGFYGSGKSSFTKYLGFALDPDRKVGNQPFLELLTDRIHSTEIKAELSTLARKQPTAVVMLDLGTEQLAINAAMPVANVLYRKTMVWAGYSTVPKIAEVERRLDAEGRLEALRTAYTEKYGGGWDEVHNDTMAGGSRLDALMPAFFPQEFPKPGDFRSHRITEELSLTEQVRRMIEIVRRKSGRKNILFLIDEAGQYVASRGDLILNLDGLARAVKEQGQGRVWIAATAQQTLTEIVEKAAINSAELFKLKDRFPIAIDLTARDIREITYRRLLTKSSEGESRLKDWFKLNGPMTVNATRIAGTSTPYPDLDQDSFVRFYPFLPTHFEILLALIRVLARRGVGLRSAIKVIQDILVDPHTHLPAGIRPIAERDFGSLACVDDFYDTLRADIERDLPHVVAGVERVRAEFPGDELALRLAKAIAALQPLDNFPRTAENLAALIYRGSGGPGLLAQVRETLQRMVAHPKLGVVEARGVDGASEDAQGVGFVFLSDGVRPLQDKRSRYQPPAGEKSQVLLTQLKAVFDPVPTTSLQNAKRITAQVRFDRAAVTDLADIALRIESVQAVRLAPRREELLTETRVAGEWKDSIAWLVTLPDEVDELLVEVCRSQAIIGEVGTPTDRDVSQFVRGEQRRAGDARDRIKRELNDALMRGTLIFRGTARAATEHGLTTDAAARSALTSAAETVYHCFRLAAISAPTDLASKLLNVERLDRAGSTLDPLKLIATTAGQARISLTHAALAEVLREFKERLDAAGGGRLQGNFIQDHFAGAPWGFSKDVTRYLFAGLLWAEEIVLYPPDAGGIVKIPGAKAADALKSALIFNRVGVGLRDGRPTLEAKDRAATRLAEMSGMDVMPTEARIGQVARTWVPGAISRVGALPTRLRLLGLQGEARALGLVENLTATLADDASAATGILGDADATIAADMTWATGALAALDGDGETLVQGARTLRADLRDLAALFPDSASLAANPAHDAIAEVLASDTFAQRMPDLRAAVRALREAVGETFTSHVAQFKAGIAEVRRRLQAMPEWPELSEADQSDVDAGLRDSEAALTVSGAPTVTHLRLLLAREQGLGVVEARLADLVRSRRPKPAPPETPIVPPETPPNVPDNDPPLSDEEMAEAERIQREFVYKPPVAAPGFGDSPFGDDDIAELDESARRFVFRPPVADPDSTTPRRVALRPFMAEFAGTTLAPADVDGFVDTLRDRLKTLTADGPIRLSLDEVDE